MSDIRGIGLDLCEISRMEKLLGNECFLEKYFTAEERSYIEEKGVAAAQSMAGIYAAKEAFLKAVGTGIAVPLKDVGVSHTKLGQPVYCLEGQAKELALGGCVMLSITHENGMAAAMCVWSL